MPSENQDLELALKAWRDVFRSIRRKRNENQQQFAEHIDFKNTSEEWERGQRPSLANLSKVEEKLGMRRGELTYLHALAVLRLGAYLAMEVADTSYSIHRDPEPFFRAVNRFCLRDEEFVDRLGKDDLLADAVEEADVSLENFKSVWEKVEANLRYSKEAG